jgi:hypothetical protein
MAQVLEHLQAWVQTQVLPPSKKKKKQKEKKISWHGGTGYNTATRKKRGKFCSGPTGCYRTTIFSFSSLFLFKVLMIESRAFHSCTC